MFAYEGLLTVLFKVYFIVLVLYVIMSQVVCISMYVC